MLHKRYSEASGEDPVSIWSGLNMRTRSRPEVLLERVQAGLSEDVRQAFPHQENGEEAKVFFRQYWFSTGEQAVVKPPVANLSNA